METEVNEKIKVWTFFDDDTSPIFPLAISWRRRLIKLHKLIFFSTQRVGGEKILRLICAGEEANFELEYTPSTYSWKLRKVMPKDG